MFEAICKLGLEGIVSKKVDAPYRSGPQALSGHIEIATASLVLFTGPAWRLKE
jgi:hypothetical protein